MLNEDIPINKDAVRRALLASKFEHVLELLPKEEVAAGVKLIEDKIRAGTFREPLENLRRKLFIALNEDDIDLLIQLILSMPVQLAKLREKIKAEPRPDTNVEQTRVVSGESAKAVVDEVQTDISVNVYSPPAPPSGPALVIPQEPIDEDEPGMIPTVIDMPWNDLMLAEEVFSGRNENIAKWLESLQRQELQVPEVFSIRDILIMEFFDLRESAIKKSRNRIKMTRQERLALRLPSTPLGKNGRYNRDIEEYIKERVDKEKSKEKTKFGHLLEYIYLDLLMHPKFIREMEYDICQKHSFEKGAVKILEVLKSSDGEDALKYSDILMKVEFMGRPDWYSIDVSTDPERKGDRMDSETLPNLGMLITKDKEKAAKFKVSASIKKLDKGFFGAIAARYIAEIKRGLPLSQARDRLYELFLEEAIHKNARHKIFEDLSPI